MDLPLRGILPEHGKKNNHPLNLVAQKAGLGPDSDQTRWAIREIKAFLDSYRESIHSLVLFGSYALGKAGCRSDIDFLVLLKSGEKVRRIRRILFDFKLRLGNDNESQGPVEIQIVDFDEKDIEYVFELSTPLGHAARDGVAIQDDGHGLIMTMKRMCSILVLESLSRQTTVLWKRTSYTTTMTRILLALQYYMQKKKLK